MKPAFFVSTSKKSASVNPRLPEALLERMPMTAMIRNLGKMTSLGLVQPFSDAAKLIVRKLGDHTNVE